MRRPERNAEVMGFTSSANSDPDAGNETPLLSEKPDEDILELKYEIRERQKLSVQCQRQRD